MALILNIETATTNCSVSLSLDGETLFLKEDNSSSYSHAELLHVFIKDLFSESKYKPDEIHAVAVSKGPGSYTGLRIGVSTAKGLCYALNKPLIAIDTLEILSRQLNIDKGYIVAMLDARRMEVYSAVFTSNFQLAREVKAEILDANSYNLILESNDVFFIGNGVEKTKALIQHSNANFIEDRLPSAREMGELAESKYKISDTEDVAYFEPYYLKDFIAIKKQS
ncbi:tRNA (adenosine(37)-N6)-threonylcarbamoyltransferase complex dimerization subunit type 1 TsaB [Winogradskyella sp. DF17]|uniref:tRNA (Adenosine(37)-N6)-threonylcarbamoyltransferase complex dimerization subunit type 1 TsaB n=1 Tax=Winogradskyella pelagia TaxID=2819984 RepID=A0ABS3T107_9FLAO|nr:tRNA (adenosine(37)-N6)-threonylcarbamoyltransferase complex dimerization subunit type 1 TsaB [Winogradskyella sp. DF17]MBO3115571.1 tRNA (adenosine(37)-N6)-threonylcarbamoyltransferase complex dimerization subunit type 1 TsaB [Winogradskyella sp. DF17]